MRKINPLLLAIRASVREAGGTRLMAYLIMQENRDIYSDWEISKVRRIADGTLRGRRYLAKLPKKMPPPFWSEEDETILLNNYGTMKTPNLAAIIGRSGTAIRDKFYRLAPPERITWVKLNGRYAGRVNNFKKLI